MQTLPNNTKDSQTPLISFILPYYNVPVSMLNECIESIRALSLGKEEREIIIIDDGSDESPINSLEHLADEIIYIRQSNAGLGAARNRGMQVASGQYLQFIDSDDRLLPDAYEQCLAMLRKADTPDLIMFNFISSENLQNLQNLPNLQNLQNLQNLPNLPTGAEYMLRHNIHATACCYIFRRAILGGLLFTPGI